MPAKPILSAAPKRAGNIDAIRPPPGVEDAFREFRQSAVRLVERVNDALGLDPEPEPEQQDNLRRVRAIFGKWSADILLALHVTPGVGFEELRRSLPGISPRVLSLKLKDLEENGMVRREIIESRPPRAKYTLTERGWTVAWLAQPVFLYLRLSTSRDVRGREPDGAKPGASLGDAGPSLVPPRSWRADPDDVLRASPRSALVVAHSHARVGLASRR